MSKDISLRPYQRQAVDSIYDYFQSGKTGNPLIVAPTGSGKSILIAKFIEEVVKEWPSQRILMLAHRKELLQQNYSKLIQLWPEAPAGVYSAGLNSRKLGRNITIAGVASIYKKADAVGWIDLIIVDESHLVPSGEDGEGMYRKLIQDLKRFNPKIKVIGFTATPFRMKTGMLTESGGIFTDICYNIEVGRLVKEGFLSPLISKIPKTQADLTNVKMRGGEFVSAEAERAMDDDSLTESAINEMEEYLEGRNSWIVFCAGVAHAHHVAKALTLRGHPAEVIVGDTEDMFRASTIRRFRAGELKVLVNCDVLTTGFDAPNIDALVLLRPTGSVGLYVQMCLDAETEILTNEGWRSHESITPIDLVATFSLETESVQFEAIEEIVKRQTTEGEFFVQINSPHLNLRVTNQHELVIRARRGKNWNKKTAETSLRMKDQSWLPVAGNITTPLGTTLNQYELSFLGWFLSDGTLNKKTNQISIAQSEVSNQHDHIRQTLEGCGFRYGICRTKRKGLLAKYPDLIRYTISMGDVRIGNGTGLNGWAKLLPWIRASKKIESIYDTLSREELLIILDSLNRGDGSKPKKFGNKKPWIPRTMAITCGLNKEMADRIQALCVVRGVSSNLTFDGKSNWILRIAPEKVLATIRGTREDDNNKNARLAVDLTTKPESVWCVRTVTGTIITRRQGKVVIMGNCGRGMRLSPETEKSNCIVLDFAGNIERHGPIDGVQIRKKKNGGDGEEVTTAPVKTCPQCNTAIAISIMTCPVCGYNFPARPVHDVEASSKSVMVTIEPPKRWSVVHVDFARHSKEGKAPSLKVTYILTGETGGNLDRKTVSEWVCVEHRGYAYQKAVEWWLKAHKHFKTPGIIKMPMSVEDAMKQRKDLRPITDIVVQKNGKFDQVISRTFGEYEEPDDPGSFKDFGDYDDGALTGSLLPPKTPYDIDMDDDEIPF